MSNGGSKSPLDMDYKELDYLLNSLLEKENLPINIEHPDEKIDFYKYNLKKYKLYKLILKFFYGTFDWHISGRFYCRKSRKFLEKMNIFPHFKEYYILFNILIPDAVKSDKKNFKKIYINYEIAVALYDASCDLKSCNQYLKDFDSLYMQNKPFTPRNEFLSIFQSSFDYLKNQCTEDEFKRFMRCIQIEHVSQIMSKYQSLNEKLTKDQLFKITWAKGGMSVLPLCQLLAPQLKDHERQAIYAMGGFLQIFDDIADIGEDLKNGINTLPNQKLITAEEVKILFTEAAYKLIETFDLKIELESYLFAFMYKRLMTAYRNYLNFDVIPKI